MALGRCPEISKGDEGHGWHLRAGHGTQHTQAGRAALLLSDNAKPGSGPWACSGRVDQEALG